MPGNLQHTDGSRPPGDCGINTSGPDKARAAAATAAFFSSRQVRACEGRVLVGLKAAYGGRYRRVFFVAADMCA